MVLVPSPDAIDILREDVHQEDEPHNNVDEEDEQNGTGRSPRSPGTRQTVREHRPPAWLASGDW